MPDDVEKKIQTYKSELQKAKSERDRLQGSLDTVMKRLKQEFSVSTIEEAEEKLKKWKIEKEKLEKDLQNIVADIESKYDFGV